jgi:DNA-binding NarL/FixJ family response regulator
VSALQTQATPEPRPGGPPAPIRIVLADDHQMVRQGLRSVLELEPDLVVVAEAEDGEQAVALATQLNPDIVLLDIKMAGLNGIEACRRITREAPHVRVIMLTSFGEEALVQEAIMAGAQAFVLKDVHLPDLVGIVRSVARGESVLDPRVTAKVMATLRSGSPSPDRLSPREQEVVRLVAQGLSNKAIGAKLFISENTVKFHLRNIMSKLGAQSRVEVASEAFKRGMV